MAAHDDPQWWERWRAGDPATEREYEQAIQPFVDGLLGEYAQNPLGRPVLEGMALAVTTETLRRHPYDPGRAKLTTFLNRYARPRFQREVLKFAPAARLPEEKALKIGTFDRARTELQGRLQREPSTLELAEELKWDPEQVEQHRASRRLEVPETVFAGPVEAGDAEVENAMRLYALGLGAEDRAHFERRLGWDGRPPARSDVEVAKQLGRTEAVVRRQRERIEQDLAGFLRAAGVPGRRGRPAAAPGRVPRGSQDFGGEMPNGFPSGKAESGMTQTVPPLPKAAHERD